MNTLSASERILAGVAYLIWPVSLVITATTLKKDRFLRFHGYQALFLGICLTVTYLVGGAFLRFIPLFGPLLINILVVTWILLGLFLAYRCIQGDYFRIPLIYDLAEGNME